MNSSEAVCRSCGQGSLQTVLDMGCTPLANALVDSSQLDRPEPTYPLELVFCRQCALVQIVETVSPEALFRDYVYFSSFADTTLTHARNLARKTIANHPLDGTSLVIEAGSNDGYLLQFYQEAGIGTLGIEPADNIAQVARLRRGIATRSEFFTEQLAHQLRAEGQAADVFHAHNVLAHVADLNGFVRGIRTVLKTNGVAIIEVPYVRDLMDHVEVDTIYHEHLCFFSLSSLHSLFQRHALVIHDVKRLSIHGGSLRLHVRHAAQAEPTPGVEELLAQEQILGVNRSQFYDTFAARVYALKSSLCAFLAELKTQECRLAAYGASAKGSTLLNFFGIGADVLDFVVDRNPVKQGRYTPGTRLHIYAPEKLLQAKPDYVLLLTWNFADEIMRQQTEYRRAGGRFIFPLPEVKVA